MNSRYRRLLAIGVVCLAAAVLATALVVKKVPEIQRRLAKDQCAENLLRIGKALREYCVEHKEEYPSLSLSPGRVTCDAERLFPDYVNDTSLFICPAHKDRASSSERAATLPTPPIDDTCYWYLGYLVVDERSALTWLREYENHIPKGEAIPNANEVWPDCVEIVTARKKEWGRIVSEYENRHGSVRKVYSAAAEAMEHERHLYQALRRDVGRFVIHEIGNPAALQYVEQSIPIVIERPWNHGDGGHVLFLDGHVEFLPYPGRFPMTVDFIEGLQQLDKLEEFPFAYDDTLHDLMRNGSPSSHPASNGF